MPGSSALAAVFRRCSDDTAKVSFTFADGQQFLGWALEVTEDQVLVSWAPSPIYAQATGGREWAPADQWVRYDAIAPGSLATYDADQQRWVDHPAAP